MNLYNVRFVMYIDVQLRASRKCHNQCLNMMAVVDVCECVASTDNLKVSAALMTMLSNRSGILELCGGVSLLVTCYCLAKSCSSMLWSSPQESGVRTTTFRCLCSQARLAIVVLYIWVHNKVNWIVLLSAQSDFYCAQAAVAEYLCLWNPDMLPGAIPWPATVAVLAGPI